MWHTKKRYLKEWLSQFRSDAKAGVLPSASAEKCFEMVLPSHAGRRHTGQIRFHLLARKSCSRSR